MSDRFWYLKLLGICLLLELCRIDAKPIRHFGRCGLSGGDTGYCVPRDECKERTEIFSDEIHSQCTSSVINNLICCPNKRPVKTSEISLPKPGVCGYSFDFRIFKGQVTHIKEFPWMAMLRYTSDGEDFTERCGGSLVHSRWVLSAAHCIPATTSQDSLQQIRLGEWNTTTNPDCQQFRNDRICAPTHQDYQIDRIIVHEQYAPPEGNRGRHESFAHDIALIRLNQSVIYTDFIMPICLPAANMNMDHRYAGYAMDIAGWGNTEDIRFGGSPIKLKTRVDAISRAACKEAYGELNAGQMCAGGSTETGSCHGDSGGPLMLLDSNNVGTQSYYLVGIVSLGTGTCNSLNHPMIFTRVEHYIPWLMGTIMSNS